MSRVFLARDVALGRHVVVKVLAPELIEGLSVERFTREIKLAAALQESHIVPVLVAGSTAEGLPYYTMPFVEGESLRVRMQEGRVPIAESLSILRDVAIRKDLQEAMKQSPDVCPMLSVDRKFNRARSSIRRTYGAIADPARAGRRAAACPPPRLGGRPDGVARRYPVARGRIGRPGGTDAHTERPRA